jgi:hypothetical protein
MNWGSKPAERPPLMIGQTWVFKTMPRLRTKIIAFGNGYVTTDTGSRHSEGFMKHMKPVDQVVVWDEFEIRKNG